MELDGILALIIAVCLVVIVALILLVDDLRPSRISQDQSAERRPD